MRFVSLVLTLLIAPLAAFASEIREVDLKTTARLGNELVMASKRTDRGFNTPAKKRAKETAVAALRDRLYDQVRYDYVVLGDPTGKGLLVYALAIAKRKGDIFIGGHFRVAVSADGASLTRVDLLSQLIKQPQEKGKEIAAIVASQIEAIRPVETWIYSSELYHLPFYVVTADGSLWGIANGRIVRADEKGPKNHLDIMNKKAPEASQ
jgi:hypothetical protein